MEVAMGDKKYWGKNIRRQWGRGKNHPLWVTEKSHPQIQLPRPPDYLMRQP